MASRLTRSLPDPHLVDGGYVNSFGNIKRLGVSGKTEHGNRTCTRI